MLQSYTTVMSTAIHPKAHLYSNAVPSIQFHELIYFSSAGMNVCSAVRDVYVLCLVMWILFWISELNKVANTTVVSVSLCIAALLTLNAFNTFAEKAGDPHKAVYSSFFVLDIRNTFTVCLLKQTHYVIGYSFILLIDYFLLISFKFFTNRQNNLSGSLTTLNWN